MWVSVLCTWWFVTSVLVYANSETDEKDVQEQFRQIINEEAYVVALFTEPCCKCADCVELEALLGASSRHLEESLNIKVVKLVDQKSLQKEYGVKTLPTIVYIRTKYPLTYDGLYDIEDIIEWLEKFKQSYVQYLNDETFEHLTQASTGATTGDWLVFFHGAACKDEKQDLQGKAETIAAKVKDRTNVAMVNMDESPELLERFKLKECPSIILFRQGKMYRYRFIEITVQYLEKFVNGWFKNSKTETVPSPKSPFDKLTDYAVVTIQEHPEVIISAGIILVLAIILFTFCASFFVKKEKVE